MKLLIGILMSMSFSAFADHHEIKNCLDFINQKALDGSNEFFQLDSNFNVANKEKFPVYESGNTHKGLFRKVNGTFEKIANNKPFYEVVVYKDTEGKVSSLTYRNSKVGSSGEIEFKHVNGNCYPHQRKQLSSGQTKSFNTELCNKIKKFWKANEQYEVCHSDAAKAAGKELQTTLGEYDQDSGCSYCGVGDWNNSSVKTVSSHPFVKSISIMSACDAQGVGTFVKNDALFPTTYSLGEKDPVEVKAKQE